MEEANNEELVNESGNKVYSLEDAEKLISDTENILRLTRKNLHQAKTLCSRVGLSMASTLTEEPIMVSNMNNGNNPISTPMLITTGGHSNTDHIVPSTGDPKADRINELKRSMKRQRKSFLPEYKGEDRWDMARVPHSGMRRRRIAREKDLPTGEFVYVHPLSILCLTQEKRHRSHQRLDTRFIYYK